MLKSIAKFIIVMMATTILLSMVWGGLITDTLYNCTDSVGFDYLKPGDWVHGQLSLVDHVVGGRSMKEPDTIRKGWSITGLWALWISMFAVSLVVSFVLARKTWMPTTWNAESGRASNRGAAAPLGYSDAMEGRPPGS